MARAGINKAVVQQARDSLLARGERPSIEAVRLELGNTGSKSTIQRYLKELASQEPRPPAVCLSEELQTFIGSSISSVAERLAAEAQDTVAADRARLERQQAAYKHQREIDQARQEELRNTHQLLLQERRDGQAREHTLSEQLQHLEGQRQRLLSAEHHFQQLLEERSRQIQSLEEKHRHARESLVHYRQQQQHQREEELSRHEAQVQQLQQELRRRQEQFMAKQEELGLLYRDLERITAERQRHTQELHNQAQELAGWPPRYQQLQDALQQEQDRCRSLELQVSLLQEKARRYVFNHRQDRRDLRVQARQLEQLQGLLSQSNG
ncbi:hypothetical protein D9M71_293540 [compost metagenome]